MKDELHISRLLSRIEPGQLSNFIQTLLLTSALTPKFVWTINLSHVREVATAPHTFTFLESNSLIVADGWPVKYLARVIASKDVSRIPGVDIVDSLLTHGVRFCVVGSDRIQVLKTLQNNKGLSSDLTFVYDKNIDLNSEIQIDEIVKLLLEFMPQYVFLALGFPKQEILFEKIRIKIPLMPAYFLGIGGSFQMLSGEKVRAPQRIQSLGLEWLWRLSQDPKRLFARYFSDGKFFISLATRREVKRFRDFTRRKMG
jgi:N-acetylglucosaminyldiphosphoundecaprenol N-acetyl-beta-D-mannosaminyltransferase